jgi:hypothetical protein
MFFIITRGGTKKSPFPSSNWIVYSSLGLIFPIIYIPTSGALEIENTLLR